MMGKHCWRCGELMRFRFGNTTWRFSTICIIDARIVIYNATHIFVFFFFLCKWDLKGLLQHGNLFIQKNVYHEISIICTLKVNDKLSVISYFDILIWGSSPLTWFIGYRISGRLFLLTENMNQSDEICIIEILYVSHWKEFWDCTLHGGLRQITFHLRLVKRLWNYCIYETCRSTPTQCMCVWVSNFFLLLRYLHSFGFIWFKLTDGDDYLFNISVVRTFVQDGCFFFFLGTNVTVWVGHGLAGAAHPFICYVWGFNYVYSTIAASQDISIRHLWHSVILF